MHTVLPGFVETEGFPQRSTLEEPAAEALRHRGRRRRAGDRGRDRARQARDHGAVVPVPPQLDPAGTRPGPLRPVSPRRPATRRASSASLRRRPGLSGHVPADLDLVRRRRRRAADALTLLVRDTGKLEPLFEVDPLVNHFRDQEHEVVGVEEAADVGRPGADAGATGRGAARSDPSPCSGSDRPSRAGPRCRIRPPGRATRASSDMASSGRRTWWRTRWEHARSNSA